MHSHLSLSKISKIGWKSIRITFLSSRQRASFCIILSLAIAAVPMVSHAELSTLLAQPSHSEAFAKDECFNKQRQEELSSEQTSKDLLDQLELLHTEVQTLRASLEQQDHRINKLEQLLLETPEKYVAVKPPLSEAAAYEKLQKKIKDPFSAEVEQAIEEFMLQYPHTPKLPDLHFFIGQQCMQQHQDKKALQHFAVIVTQYPHYSKHPDALLSTGILFKRLGETKEARFSFQKLLKQYPGTPFAKQATEQLASLKP